MDLDPHGQPYAPVNAPRRTVRDLSEMLGVVKGVLFDGAVSEQEARALHDWIGAHGDVMREWPGSVLGDRLERIFRDGTITEMERRDLHDLLEDLVGGVAGVVCGLTAPTDLPICSPPPEVEITDRVFVFTGRFAIGPRAACEEAVKRVGGWPEPSITQRTDFLVIGTFASRDWRTSSMGTKILKAVEYREKFGHPRIIAEDHWAAQL